jgi:Tfp pilus assembly protein PilZ
MIEQERRRRPRFAVRVPVRVSRGHEAFSAMLKDLCQDAVLVEMDKALAVDTEVAVAAALPGTGGPMQVVGRVVRVTPVEGGRHEVAVLFTDVTPAAETRIEYFVTLQGG